MRSVLALAGWVEVAPRVFVHTSRRELTTTTLVIAPGDAPRQALLVDPAWDPDELAGMSATLAAAEIVVTGGFSTHAHHDHLLWHPGFGRAARWASPDTVRTADRHRPEILAGLDAGFPAELLALVGRVRPAEELPWTGRRIRMITHDGHEVGHTALYIDDARTLLAGDMLSDVELPIAEREPLGPDPAEPLDAYLEGLSALAPFAARARMVVPGHGHPGREPGSRVAADRRYWAGLLAGGDATDARRQYAGMAAVQEQNRLLAAAYRDRRRRRGALGVE